MIRRVIFVTLAGFMLMRNRFVKLKTARSGQKVKVISEQVTRGKLNDGIINTMLEILGTEVDTHAVSPDLIHKAGAKLAKYGTPESCLLSLHLSNYSGIAYPEETNELLREAVCKFEVTRSNSRTVDILRGKYLFEDIIRCPHQNSLSQ